VANVQSDAVSVLIGRGDGTFDDELRFDTGDAPSSVTIADLDGDKVPDLAVANRISNEVSVLIGNGDGTFQPQQRFSAGV